MVNLTVGKKYKLNDKTFIVIGFANNDGDTLYMSTVFRMSIFAYDSFFFLCTEKMLRQYYRYLTAIAFDVKEQTIKSVFLYKGDFVDIKEVGKVKDYDKLWVKLCLMRQDFCSTLMMESDIAKVPIGEYTYSDIYMNFYSQFDNKDSVTLFDDFTMTKDSGTIIATNIFTKKIIKLPFTKENVETLAHLGSLNKPEFRYVVEALKF